jgi:hypothetical protein
VSGDVGTLTIASSGIPDSTWLFVSVVNSKTAASVLTAAYHDSALTQLSVRGRAPTGFVRVFGRYFASAQGAENITVTFTGTTADSAVAMATYVEGLRPDALDRSATNNDASATASSGATLATLHAHEYVMGVVAVLGDTAQAAGGWTQSLLPVQARSSATGGMSLWSAYKETSALAIQYAVKGVLTARPWTAICLTFAAREDSALVTVTNSDRGTISPATSEIAYETTQTFTATPAGGYRVKHWILDGKIATSSPGALTFPLFVADPHYLWAVFERTPAVNRPTPSGRGKRW